MTPPPPPSRSGVTDTGGAVRRNTGCIHGTGQRTTNGKQEREEGGWIKMEERRGGFIYFGTEDTGREMERTTVSPLTVIAERGEFLLCWLLPSFLNSFLSG